MVVPERGGLNGMRPFLIVWTAQAFSLLGSALTWIPCWEPIDDKWHRIRPLVVRMADPGPGDTVLDVATGAGYQAAAFAAALRLSVL